MAPAAGAPQGAETIGEPKESKEEKKEDKKEGQ
jgi:hypothetical protein